MTMQYIRDHYDQRFARGTRVQVRHHNQLYAGTVVGASDAYLRVRLYPNRRALLFHPSDVVILPDDSTGTEVQP